MSEQTELTVHPEILQSVNSCVQELSLMLNDRQPGIADQCKKINDLLRQDPNMAAMLTEAQIGIFMRAHYNVAHIEFAQPKGKAKSTKALKNLAASEIKDLVI